MLADGEVACWGNDSDGEATPPGGSFAQVSAGRGYTCGVRPGGEVACWGNTGFGKATPPEGSFEQVSAGKWHTCGVRPGGEVACWGDTGFGKATPPEGTFAQVSAGWDHTCGVRTGGAVACWGRNGSGQATPPVGAFAQVSAGKWHTCGVLTDGEVACWGNDSDGQATPLGGSFAQVSAGWDHTCGVRTGGEVACWGNDWSGRATPPEGSFEQVSADQRHTCGVRTGGAVACWGARARDSVGAGVVGTVPTLSVDHAALIALYNATDGPKWTNQDGWLTGAPLGEWHGVTADDQGQVIRLELPDNNLAGPIPPELGGLGKLERLSLWGNQLTGVIPARLGDLANLQELLLHDNLLSGKVPQALGDLAIRRTLTTVYLDGNDDLTDCLPIELIVVSENDFQDLGLPYCPLSYSRHSSGDYVRNALAVFYNATGGPQGKWKNSENWLSDKPLGEWYGLTTLDELGENTTELVNIDLAENGLSGQLPGTLGYLRHLEGLNLSGNELTGPIPANLGDLYDLRNLHLGDNQLTGAIPAELSNSYLLRNLYLYQNQLSGAIPGQLGNLYGLKTLSLHTNQLIDRLPAGLSRLADLRSLNLEDNGLWGEIPAWLGDLTELTGLYLGHNSLFGEIPEELGKLEDLRELYLDDQNIFRSVSIMNLELTIKQHNNFSTLNRYWLHGEIPGELGNLAQLEELDLSDNRLWGSIPEYLGDLEDLTTLRLGGNKLDGEIPEDLGNLSRLNQLDLGENDLSGKIPVSLGWLPLVAVDLYHNAFDPAGCVPANLVRVGAKPGRFGLPAKCPTPEELDALEAEVLGDLYLGTNGDQWTINTNWFDGDKPYAYSAWHGVYTNNEGRIIGLDLSDNNLNGPIYSSLAELPELKWLRLYGNPLTGCIPIGLKDKLLVDQYAQETAQDDGGLFKVLPEAPGLVKDFVGLAATTALGVARKEGAAQWFSVGFTSTEKGSELLAEAIYNHNPGQLGLPLCPTPAPDPDVDVAEQTSATDKATLLAIRDYYVRKDENNSDQFSDWQENDDRIGEWSGVQSRTINGADRVTRLSLDKRGLVGGIPRQLGNLGELRYLNLSRNKLTGPIPAELGNLVNLHTLALNDNQLSNYDELSNAIGPPIPKELSNLVRLEEFYLQNNRLVGVIPQELAILTYSSMRIMDIDRTGERFLSGCLPPKNWGLGINIRDAALGVSDTVTWTLLSGGIHGITRSGAAAAKAAGKDGVEIAVPAGVKAFAPVFKSGTIRNNLTKNITSHFPNMSKKTAEAIAENVEDELINQFVKYGASNYADGTVGNLVSAFFGPVSALSDVFAEQFGSIAEYFGWYGLGGKLEMGKVYCPG